MCVDWKRIAPKYGWQKTYQAARRQWKLRWLFHALHQLRHGQCPEPIQSSTMNITHTLKTSRLLLTIIAWAAISCPKVSAAIVIEHTSGTGGAAYFPGNLVTTPSGGPWNNITFSWLLANNTPNAFGTLYIFTEPTDEKPSTISGESDGFVGSSLSISSGAYIFAPGLTLAPATAYYFYSDTSGTVGSENVATPGEAGFRAIFPSGSASTYDLLSPTVHKYRLGGDLVPEPATALLLGMGVLVTAFQRRRRNAEPQR